MEYPFEGKLCASPNKAFAPTIVFLPHYGGSYATSKRHQEMVSAMGFDSFAFNFSLNNVPLRVDQMAEVLREGMIERWTRELEVVLETLKGPKIIYSFSLPSISLPALQFKKPRRDVVGWVCDGGPFTELWGNLWNFHTYQMPVRFKPIRYARTGISHLFIGGFTYSSRVRKWMSAFPVGVPGITNVRGCIAKFAENTRSIDDLLTN